MSGAFYKERTTETGVNMRAIALASAAIVAASPVTATPPEATASLVGSAKIAYKQGPNDDVRFTFDAHATYTDPEANPIPTKAWGTARVWHYFADVQPKPVTIWADVAVDCLTTAGNVAIITGQVVRAAPEVADWQIRGIRLAFSVYDSPRGDRVGFSGGTDKDKPLLTPCMGPAPFLHVQRGNYVLSSWEKR